MSAKLVAARALLKVFLVAALDVAVGSFGLQCSPFALPVYRPLWRQQVNIMNVLRKCIKVTENRDEGAVPWCSGTGQQGTG